MVHAVTPSLSVGRIDHVYDISFMWGFSSGFIIYCTLSYFWPATETLVQTTIYDETQIVDGVLVYNDGGATPPDEKFGTKSISEETAETSSV